ncbi:MAG: hypothetical protein IT341_06350 [Chloroflexi bacterium]|nr:hypothetical protein [Chloroflexota bacterium]
MFTTGATGWGEILTDPSHAGQIVGSSQHVPCAP